MQFRLSIQIWQVSPEVESDDEGYTTVPGKEALGLSGEFAFVYSYPLVNEVRFRRQMEPGMSAFDLMLLGAEDYRRMYREEEVAGSPGRVPGMYNRAPTEGPYGIYGHDLRDLGFEMIEVDVENRTVSFAVGS
jgi:hypothetical protein